MKTKHRYSKIKSFSFFFFLLSLFVLSCNRRVSSFAMVNESRESIDEFWSNAEDPEHYWHSYYTKVTLKDSLFIILDGERQPMEVMYSFKGDTCIFQHMNLYCSPCAERAVNNILSDKRYRFKEIDGVNYISKNQKGVVLRLGSSLKDDTVCSEIKIIRLDTEEYDKLLEKLK